MRGVCLALALLIAGGMLPAPAAADGAWRTFLRPRTFTQLVAESDTVWCATREGGLVRYAPSASRFSAHLREPGGLASNRLSSLAFDRARRLWVGTLGRGVSVLSADRSSWAGVNTFDGLPSDSVTVLTAQGDSMWIGTTRGLALWDGRQIAGRVPDRINPSPFASDSVTGIALLGDSLWVATAGGAYVSRLSQGLSAFAPAGTGLAAGAVLALANDGSGLHALSGGLVHRFDGATRRWTPLPGIGRVFWLSESRRALFASSAQGLYRREGEAWVQLNAGLAASDAGYFAAARDTTGRVYAAGRPASRLYGDESATGLYRQPDGGGAWEFAYPPGPPGNDCLNLDLDGPRVYVTTNATGIGRFDGVAWRSWFPTPDFPSTSDTTFRNPLFTYAVLVDKLGRKWFGTWAQTPYLQNSTKCWVYDAGAIEILNDAGSVPDVTRFFYGAPADARQSFARASALDSSGGHWFGMDSPCTDDPAYESVGIEYYEAGGAYGGNYNALNSGGGLLSNYVWALAVDRSNRVWIGSSKGLSHFDNPPAGASSIQAVPGTDQYVVRALAAHKDTLWALTSSEIWRYSINGTKRAEYTVPAGPAAQAVRPLDVGPDGTLWAGTANGMRAYPPGRSARDYNSSNSPIADDEVRTVRVDRRTGVVWIATAGGLSRFDPAYVPATPVLPSLAVCVYPNPARLTALGFALRLAGTAADYRGVVCDLRGRVVRAFEAPRGNRAVWDGSGPCGGPAIWDGRDHRGRLVKPGVYFLRVESGGRSVVTRVAVVR